MKKIISLDAANKQAQVKKSLRLCVAKNDFREFIMEDIFPEMRERHSLFFTVESGRGNIELFGEVADKYLIFDHVIIPAELYVPGLLRTLLANCLLYAIQYKKQRIYITISMSDFYNLLNGPFKQLGYHRGRGTKATKFTFTGRVQELKKRCKL